MLRQFLDQNRGRDQTRGLEKDQDQDPDLDRGPEKDPDRGLGQENRTPHRDQDLIHQNLRDHYLVLGKDHDLDRGADPRE